MMKMICAAVLAIGVQLDANAFNRTFTGASDAGDYIMTCNGTPEHTDANTSPWTACDYATAAETWFCAGHTNGTTACTDIVGSYGDYITDIPLITAGEKTGNYCWCRVDGAWAAVGWRDTCNCARACATDAANNTSNCSHLRSALLIPATH